jgi:hypothetical protein
MFNRIVPGLEYDSISKRLAGLPLFSFRTATVGPKTSEVTLMPSVPATSSLIFAACLVIAGSSAIGTAVAQSNTALPRAQQTPIANQDASAQANPDAHRRPDGGCCPGPIRAQYP